MLRADNADQRLTDKAIALGIASAERERHWSDKKQHLANAKRMLSQHAAPPRELEKHDLPLARDGHARTPAELLSLDGIKLTNLVSLWPELSDIPVQIHEQLETDCRYSGYLARQEADISAMRRDEALIIPAHLMFSDIGGLSAESQDLLLRHRPATIGQAGRIPGMTPAAIVAVLRHIRRQEKDQNAREYSA